MQWLDYTVLIAYFAALIVIGIVCSYRVRGQDDFFMGRRSFGRLLQTFAAFGSGTGANEPIQLGRTTWTSGLSGIWSVLMWLFVTPFYWNLAVWYRRLRHLTIGDFFVERYESRALGAAYTAFAFCFYILFLSTMFSAISKVTVPLLGADTVRSFGLANEDHLKYFLVPVIGLITAVYGVLGGLRAAYWTDLIQGTCIVFLSLILIPFGLSELVQQYGTSPDGNLLDGFAIMHDRVPPEYFQIVGGPRAGEFPLHFIVSLTLLGLVGIVVHPHMISVGGGSAKSEYEGRVGLVTGSFLKRLCTIGWALTALIVLALMADNVEAARDPDHVWGIACREILAPRGWGLVGLMLASLLAALMSSADCYMLTLSALIVRNVYAPYFHASASERTYVLVGRIASVVIIIGGVVASMLMYDVFEQFKLTMEFTIVFAAPFWLGMCWRRANSLSAWSTIAVSALVFFVLPIALPACLPSLRTHSALMLTSDVVTIIHKRPATPIDYARRRAWRTARREAELLADPAERESALRRLGPPPTDVSADGMVEDQVTTGGQTVFWSGGADELIASETEAIRRDRQGNTTVVTERVRRRFTGQGRLNCEFLVYHWLGIDLQARTNAELQSLRVPLKVVLPFLIMVIVALVTRPSRSPNLDRFFAKLKTPVAPDPTDDQRRVENAMSNPDYLEARKLFPGTFIELEKLQWIDIVGFAACLGVCFAIVGLALWVAQLGG